MGRTRRRKTTNAAKEKANISLAALSATAERIAGIKAEMEVLQAEAIELWTESEGLMEYLKLTEHKVPGFGTHTLKPTRTNAKNTVRAKEFMEAVGDNAFWAVAEVPMGKAKEHLGEKELSQVTDTIPGSTGDPVYKFKP